jgi:hypothetical protein
MTSTVRGTYGGSQTSCRVFVYQDHRDINWYAVEDSVNVNATYEDVLDGVDVEELEDLDCFTWDEEIDSEEMLEAAVRES